MADEKKKYAVNGDALYANYYANGQNATPDGAPSLTDLYQQITTRPAFSYDVGTDPLYTQARDRYVQQGKMAMRDTIGQGAALTGGYGNSYAQSAGSQAYDRYLQGLSDMVPELQDSALQRYTAEGNRLMQKYNMAQDAENTAYTRQQNTYKDLYSMILSTGYQPTDAELAAAGMPKEVANRLRTIAIMRNGDLANIDANGNYVAPAVEEAAYGWGGSRKSAFDQAKEEALWAVDQGFSLKAINGGIIGADQLTNKEKNSLMGIVKGAANAGKAQTTKAPTRDDKKASWLYKNGLV